MFHKDVYGQREKTASSRPSRALLMLVVLLTGGGADAAQQALLRSSYQSWAGYGAENLERHEPCPPQTLQPFPLPDACFPPGPYPYTSINGVFKAVIHSPVPTSWNDAGRQYTESFYTAADGQLVGEANDEVYTYSKTFVDDGCVPNEPFNFAIQQCGQAETDKNVGRPRSCPLGNPINQASGNKFHIEVDSARNGLRGLEFKRVYNSSTLNRGLIQNRLLGYGWSGTYFQSLHVFTSGSPPRESVLLKRPDGKQIIFNREGARWRADADIHSILDEQLNKEGVRTGWRLFTEDNTIELYSAPGRLRSISDLRGGMHTLEYDYLRGTSSGRLKRVNSNTGEFLLFHYDAYDRISAISDHAERHWRYRYSTTGYHSNLQYVDYPDGSSKQYHYEDTNFPHALTGISDERGMRYATYGYDRQGRANLSTHADNVQRVEIVYNPDGTRTVTNSLGHSSRYDTVVQLGTALVERVSGPGCSSCRNSNSSYTYDPATNNLLNKTENGITTEYGDYDAKGQYGYKIEAVGTPVQRRTDYRYDARFFNRLTSVTEMSVNPSGKKVTTYTYDTAGNRTSETIAGYAPDGQGGFVPVSRTRSWVYAGPMHQLSLVDGPRTDVADHTIYRYYADDPLEGNNRARLKEIEDASGNLVRSNIRYSTTGKVLSEERGNDLRLAYSYYPGNDRLETLTQSDGISNRITRWSYLATGEMETLTTGFGTAEAVTFTFAYDNARRLTRIGDGLGNYIEYTLDAEGNRSSERIFDASGVLRKQIERSFDVYNRLDRIGQANESADYDFAPDGTLKLKTDGNNIITDYGYDSLKRLTKITRDLGGRDPSTANTTTLYDYNADDRISSVTDPVNGRTSYAYDDLGNLVSLISPDSGATTLSYDEAGNLTSKIDAMGQVFHYSYDALNRLIAIDAPGTANDISYRYDNCPNGAGRLCGITRNQVDNSYAYTSFGEITAISQSVNSWPGYQHADIDISLTYGVGARLSAIRYPSGAWVSYRYDAAGQLKAVELDRDGTRIPLLIGASYLPFGPVSSQLYGNDIQLFGWYDLAYRPWVIVNGGVAYDVLDYDGNGNATSQSLHAGSNTFSYDALNRLEKGVGIFGNRDYVYDSNGNRTQLKADGLIVHYTYAQASNRLSGVNGRPVTLDANGNTTGLQHMKLSYSTDNRLRRVGDAAEYTYNGLGQRVQKTNRARGWAGQYGFGTKRLFTYGRNGELLAETGPTGQVTREYVYANGTLLAILDHVARTEGAPIFNADMDEDGVITVEDYPQWYFNHYLMADDSLEVSGDGVMDANDATLVWSCASVQNSCVVVNYDSSIYYVHNDHLGTPMALTDAQGIKVWSAVYDPFGKATINEDVDGNGESVTLNIRFPGQYYDQETGLHYNYFRYYDPHSGRYLTSDPIGLEGGLNTFVYGLNNPLIYFDPLGLICRKSASRGMRCSRGPGQGSGRIGVFGCLVGCVSFMEGDSESQASMQPTIGGGLSFCTSPKEARSTCDDKNEKGEGCGIYDPNCDNELNFGFSPPGRAGFFLSISLNKDRSICLNIGPHAGLPGPSMGLGDLSE